MVVYLTAAVEENILTVISVEKLENVSNSFFLGKRVNATSGRHNWKYRKCCKRA